MDLAVVGIAFAAIFLVELPDKTFIAALVLSTRYRPLAVWVGVGLAFLVQTVLAVTVGKVVTFLPHEIVQGVALVIFLVGAVQLFREAPRADAGEAATERRYESRAAEAREGLTAVGASFLVLFAAEWGDLSQLLTISMVGRYQEATSVFVGAWGALLVVSALAVLVGRYLLQHVRLSWVHYTGGVVCLLLAGFTGYELLS